VNKVRTLIINARKIDADGVTENFWMSMDTHIREIGTGSPPNTYSNDTVDAKGRWLTPGFVDLHCHGGAGFSFGGDEEDLSRALEPHRVRGTTRNVLSLVSDSVDSLARSLRTVAKYAQNDKLVVGSHIEGPFLSQLHRGAHDPKVLAAPNPADLETLLDASDGTLVQVTLAPELDGAEYAIDTLIRRGVRVGIGHTDATYRVAQRAFDQGANILTHAFNAMRPIHHREPGPLVAAFEDDRVTLEFILDGHHSATAIARLAFREAPGRVALITDAMSAAGAGDGEYRLGCHDVTVRDGRAVLRDTETLAGSTLTQDVALRFALGEAGLSPVDAVTAVTLSPSRALGLEDQIGLLRPGFVADAVLLSPDWFVERVWGQGERIL